MVTPLMREMPRQARNDDFSLQRLALGPIATAP